MSTLYCLKDKLLMLELFNGRLNQYGVVEEDLEPGITLERRRSLTDGKLVIWVDADENGYVSYLKHSGYPPFHILNAICEEFETTVYCEWDPQFWGFDTDEEWEAAMDLLGREHDDEFYADIIKFLAGKDHGIRYGTIGMIQANIAKEIVSLRPELIEPDNKEELLAAIDAIYNRKHSVKVKINMEEFKFQIKIDSGEILPN